MTATMTAPVHPARAGRRATSTAASGCGPPHTPDALTHLDQQDLETFIARLRPSADLDARGVRFTGQLPGRNGDIWTGSRVDQPLTTAGSYIEMIARFTGPVLLGLALLPIRNRVKR